MKQTKNRFAIIGLLAIMLGVTGCVSQEDQLLAMSESQVALRNMQSRVFDTTDREKMLRTIIATLQDLGFVIDKADATLGTVSATKLDIWETRVTVSVRLRGETQLLVRASAQFQRNAIEDPEPYRNFFAALGRAMFLTAHAAD